MATGKEIARTALQAYDCDGGYIFGQQGATWTAAKQASVEKRYNADPEHMSDYKGSAQYGKQWIGHRVWDCAGLCRWAAKENGAAIHSGSNLIWNNDLAYKGALVDKMQLPVGALVFTGTAAKKPHVGVYTGDEIVTEAAGARQGVIQSSLWCGKWKFWGLIKGVEYEFIPGSQPAPETKHKTVKKGSTGADVMELQQDLMQLGYDIGRTGADGIFGAKTEEAVRAFQKAAGLTADGICGKNTWAAIIAAIDKQPEPEPEPAEEWYTVTIPHRTKTSAEKIVAMYEGATMEPEGSEG